MLDGTCSRGGIGEDVHLGLRIRIVGKPPTHGDALDPDDHQQPPAIRKLGRLHDARACAYRNPHVATADLAAPLDEDDAEASVAIQTVMGQGPIARLEHVQWHGHTGEEDRSQRKHGQHFTPHCVSPVSAVDGGASG